MIFIKLTNYGLIVSGIMALLLASAVLVSADDIVSQKKDLEKIQKEIENSRNNLDSLKSRESKIQKDISDYQQRESMNKTILNRLSNQLSNLRKNIDNSKTNLESSEKLYESGKSRYINNLRYYYSGTRAEAVNTWDEIEKEHNAFKRIVYLRSLAAQDKEELTMAADYLNDAEAQYSNLVIEEKSVDKVRSKKRSESTIISSQREKREKDLSKVRRDKESEADRLITLSEAARQMEELIDRLERAREARERADSDILFDFKTGNFATYKGRLLPPLRGKIVASFGWKTDKKTFLKSYSPGIEIKGAKNSPVVVIASGVVAFTGFIRGYSNFVIIEHEDGFYSTYAGLDELTVIQNQIVDAGEKLGITPTGIAKFELRQGRQPLDPVEWMKIDSFK